MPDSTEQQRSRPPKPAGATPRIALTIAGSDSGGGAGIQADLKTFHHFGVYGTSALTLITAQNTLGVREVQLLRPELVSTQIEVVAVDFEVRAAKTGALGSPELIEAVAAGVEEHAIPNLVVDPVMISKHGDPLLAKGAVEALRTRLFPRAALVTPNLYEAAELLGGPVECEEQMQDAARAVELGERRLGLELEGPFGDTLAQAHSNDPQEGDGRDIWRTRGSRQSQRRTRNT